MSVRKFYDESLQPYLVWSKNLNIHFGYWSWGINPFRLESMLAQMNLEVARRLELLPSSSPALLDIGCGYGATLFELAQQLPKAKIHGVTLSAEQITYGEKQAKLRGFSDRLFFHDADFHSLPFPDDFADGALMVESACYANGKNKETLIQELARVLRPGSQVVVIDGFRRHGRPLPSRVDKIYRKNLQYWHLSELADIHHFKKIMEQTGFENVQVEDWSWRMLPSSLHIPRVVFQLFFQKSNPKKRKYAQALLHTLLLGSLRRHFGYYSVVARKSIL